MRILSNLLAFAGLVLTLLVVWRQSRAGQVRLFIAQSIVLAALAVVIGLLADRRGLLAVAAVFLLLKVWLIPRALGRLALGEPARASAPGRSTGVAVVVAGALVVVAYMVMLPVTTAPRAAGLVTLDAIPLAFAMALIGLYLCVLGRDALGQVLGFLVFENGIFGLALLATYGLPGIVEAGVLLEVLVLVLLMEGMIVQIRREHDSIEVDRLRELRG
jgi:hydrogenase-4 component E